MLALLLTALALVLAACGGGARENELSTAERAEASRAESALSSYCRKARAYVLGRRGPLSASEFQETKDRLSRLFSLAREKPDAQYRAGKTLRSLLANTAEDLEATNCSPSLGQEVERAFNSLPPP